MAGEDDDNLVTALPALIDVLVPIASALSDGYKAASLVVVRAEPHFILSLYTKIPS